MSSMRNSRPRPSKKLNSRPRPSKTLKNQNSAEFKAALVWFCEHSVLDAAFARAFAKGLPEAARESHLMKFAASFCSSGKRDKLFRKASPRVIKQAG